MKNKKAADRGPQKEDKSYNEERIGLESKIDTDPLGSYTGVPDDPYDEPVQDVDDL